MALFNTGAKEDKQVQKVYEMLHKYGLEELSDPRDVESVKQIAYKLAGSNLINLEPAAGNRGAELDHHTAAG